MGFFAGFVLPVVVSVMCYVLIIKAVSDQSAMMNKTAEKMKAETAKEAREKKQEIKLAKIAAGTMTLFIISWISYGILAMLAITEYVHKFTYSRI